ncbi:MAG TPA: hypothetical protein VGO78_26435 [Acidimicrobiales bacterium]|nr:hypothetical protein [Acidimicrobiales bacterium]
MLLYGVEPLTNLGLGQVAVSGEVQQVLLLHVETGQFGGRLVPGNAGGGLVVGQHRLHVLLDPDDKVRGKPQRGVVLGDGVFHVFRSDEGCDAAEVLLPAPAEEVAVVAAVALDERHDEAVHLTPLPTCTAPQAALEVVVVGALALVRPALGSDDLLHPVEERQGDEGLVSAVVLLAFVDDPAEVVAVGQEAPHRFRRGRLGRVLARSGA